jgi:multiple sugar transport system permease protein
MKSRGIVKRIFLYLAVALLFIWIVIPIFWMFISSITPSKELLTLNGPWIPQHPNFQRYMAILLGGEINLNGVSIAAPAGVFRKSILNSLIVSGLTTVYSLVFGSTAAYAFARLKFKGKNQLLFLALFFQLLPPIALIIPYYFMVRSVDMIDKLGTLVIMYISFVLSYVIWVMNGYFKTIPDDLEAAARIDGCSRMGAFIRILVPSAAPGFVAVGALAFFMSWDEFMYALIFTNSMGSKTIPVAISEFSTQFGVDYGMMMTGGVFTMIIPMILALIFQRYIVSGLTSGAVKE